MPKDVERRDADRGRRRLIDRHTDLAAVGKPFVVAMVIGLVIGTALYAVSCVALPDQQLTVGTPGAAGSPGAPVDERKGLVAAVEIVVNSGLLGPVIIGVAAGGVLFLLYLLLSGVLPVRHDIAGGDKSLPEVFEGRIREIADRRRVAAARREQGDGSQPLDADEEKARALFDAGMPAQSSADSSAAGHPDDSVSRTGDAAGSPGCSPEDAHRDDDLLVGMNYWLARRVGPVITALVSQGPESARAENQALADEDEACIASMLVPAQACLWLLPLLGFLGTVWGLHNAIGPLKRGVHTMMAAMAADPLKSQGMRDSAVGLFGNGFEGLRTAFDTTLLGLAGVVVVGLLLYLMRKTAADALSLIFELIEQAVRQCPKQSPLRLLDKICQATELGLVHAGEDGPVAKLDGIAATVSRGLIGEPQGAQQGGPLLVSVTHTIKEEGHTTREVVKEVAKKLTDEVERDGEDFRKIGVALYREARDMRLVQYGAIAADLRRIRKVACPDVRDDYLVAPEISLVLQLPEEDEVQRIAVARGALKACVGGRTKRNRGDFYYFAEEQSIQFRDSGVELAPGLKYIEAAVRRAASRGEMSSDDVEAELLGITYNRDGDVLFLLPTTGHVRVLSTREGISPYHECLVDGYTAHPFVWLPDVDDLPYAGWWQEDDDGDTFTYGLISADYSRSATLDDPLQALLNGLAGGGRVRLATAVDDALVAFAGPDTMAIARKGGPYHLKLAHKATREDVLAGIGGGIVAVDLNAACGAVVFGTDQGRVYRWRLGDELELIAETQPVTHALLSKDGRSLAVATASHIELYELDQIAQPRFFDTRGAQINTVAPSADRGHILVATQGNEVMLFSFGLKIGV